MHLDGYKYWLAYKKGTKSYFRCSRSKSQKCPGKVIMDSQKVIKVIEHDHEKEARNSAVEKFRKVLTKKSAEKPNKSLVDIYLEETINHSEASILYPFSQAESTMRKARRKNDEGGHKNEEKLPKKVKETTYCGRNSQQYQKYFYVEDFEDEMKVIFMNQATLKVLGKIDEIQVDCGLKVEVDGKCESDCKYSHKKAQNLIENPQIVIQNPQVTVRGPQTSTNTEILSEDPQIAFINPEMSFESAEVFDNPQTPPELITLVAQKSNSSNFLYENAEYLQISPNILQYSTLNPKVVEVSIKSSAETSDSHLSSQSLPEYQQNPQISTEFITLVPELTSSTYLNMNNTQTFHLMTIIAITQGRDCPIAFGLLKSINYPSIHQFLQQFIAKIPINPAVIVTNQNPIVHQSIQGIWPESTIKVMYFYYAKSVVENLQIDKISKNIFEMSSLKMILSMPLIPTNYIVPGWEALRKWISEKNVSLDAVCDDIYVKWLAENAERISIFNGLTHSINNHTQVFQSELINSFNGSQLTGADELIDKICRRATKSFQKYSKTSEGLAKKIQKLQKTVKIATKNWISSPFHLRRPIQFLQQVSHCIDDGMINFVVNFDGHYSRMRKFEPPPLIFYDRAEVTSVGGAGGKTLTNHLNLSTEPPPLAPITR